MLTTRSPPRRRPTPRNRPAPQRCRRRQRRAPRLPAPRPVRLATRYCRPASCHRIAQRWCRHAARPKPADWPAHRRHHHRLHCSRVVGSTSTPEATTRPSMSAALEREGAVDVSDRLCQSLTLTSGDRCGRLSLSDRGSRIGHARLDTPFSPRPLTSPSTARRGSRGSCRARRREGCHRRRAGHPLDLVALQLCTHQPQYYEQAFATVKGRYAKHQMACVSTSAINCSHLSRSSAHASDDRRVAEDPSGPAAPMVKINARFSRPSVSV